MSIALKNCEVNFLLGENIMGQQQLLLIVLGVIVVGIAVAIGINIFS
jgi:hypothetical protein